MQYTKKKTNHQDMNRWEQVDPNHPHAWKSALKEMTQRRLVTGVRGKKVCLPPRMKTRDWRIKGSIQDGNYKDPGVHLSDGPQQ